MSHRRRLLTPPPIDGEGTARDEPTTLAYRKKFKKGKGYKLHKDDCLCAICIMKRRRREREAREVEEARESGVVTPSPQIRVSQTSIAEEYKQEAMADQIEQIGVTIESQQKQLEDLCLTRKLLAGTEEELKECKYTIKEKEFIISEQKKSRECFG